MSKISCVLFDIGGVLINWENLWLIEHVSERFNLSEQKVKESFEKNLDDYSRGKFDEREFWHLIGNEIGSLELMNLEESLYDEFCSKKMSVNSSVYELSKKLKKQGLEIGIISNTEHSIYSLVKKIIQTDHFDYKFLSYQMGLIKSDSKMFDYVLTKLDHKKENILLIDDCFSVVESAKLFGFNSIQYLSDEDLLSQLRKLDVL